MKYSNRIAAVLIISAQCANLPEEESSLEVNMSCHGGDGFVFPHRYPREYLGPGSIGFQIRKLSKIFDINPTRALKLSKHLPALPEGAEGWFAYPSVEALAEEYFSQDPAERYVNAVNLVLEKLGNSRRLINFCEEIISPKFLWLHERTAQKMEKIARTQEGDIHIIAAQLGALHAGESVRFARAGFSVNEFGLDILITGSIALTHPERFSNKNELDVNCTGNELKPIDRCEFSYAPAFAYDESLTLVPIDIECASASYGSASGFLPLIETGKRIRLFERIPIQEAVLV